MGHSYWCWTICINSNTPTVDNPMQHIYGHKEIIKSVGFRKMWAHSLPHIKKSVSIHCYIHHKIPPTWIICPYGGALTVHTERRTEEWLTLKFEQSKAWDAHVRRRCAGGATEVSTLMAGVWIAAPQGAGEAGLFSWMWFGVAGGGAPGPKKHNGAILFEHD